MSGKDHDVDSHERDGVASVARILPSGSGAFPKSQHHRVAPNAVSEDKGTKRKDHLSLSEESLNFPRERKKWSKPCSTVQSCSSHSIAENKPETKLIQPDTDSLVIGADSLMAQKFQELELAQSHVDHSNASVTNLRAPSAGSVSSAASSKPLEWDSGADVGYINQQVYEGRAQQKNLYSLSGFQDESQELEHHVVSHTALSIQSFDGSIYPLQESTPKIYPGYAVVPPLNLALLKDDSQSSSDVCESVNTSDDHVNGSFKNYNQESCRSYNSQAKPAAVTNLAKSASTSSASTVVSTAPMGQGIVKIIKQAVADVPSENREALMIAAGTRHLQEILLTVPAEKRNDLISEAVFELCSCGSPEMCRVGIHLLMTVNNPKTSFPKESEEVQTGKSITSVVDGSLDSMVCDHSSRVQSVSPTTPIISASSSHAMAIDEEQQHWQYQCISAAQSQEEVHSLLKEYEAALAVLTVRSRSCDKVMIDGKSLLEESTSMSVHDVYQDSRRELLTNLLDRASSDVQSKQTDDPSSPDALSTASTRMSTTRSEVHFMSLLLNSASKQHDSKLRDVLWLSEMIETLQGRLIYLKERKKEKDNKRDDVSLPTISECLESISLRSDVDDENVCSMPSQDQASYSVSNKTTKTVGTQTYNLPRFTDSSRVSPMVSSDTMSSVCAKPYIETGAIPKTKRNLSLSSDRELDTSPLHIIPESRKTRKQKPESRPDILFKKDKMESQSLSSVHSKKAEDKGEQKKKKIDKKLGSDSDQWMQEIAKFNRSKDVEQRKLKSKSSKLSGYAAGNSSKPSSYVHFSSNAKSLKHSKKPGGVESELQYSCKETHISARSQDLSRPSNTSDEHKENVHGSNSVYRSEIYPTTVEHAPLRSDIYQRDLSHISAKPHVSDDSVLKQEGTKNKIFNLYIQPSDDVNTRRGWSDGAVSLQESLMQSHPSFIRHANSRQGLIDDLTEYRKIRGEQRKKFLLEAERSKRVPSGYPPGCLPPSALKVGRIFTRKEIIARNKKLYNNLPEVQKQQEELKKVEEKKLHRNMKQMFVKKMKDKVVHHRKIDFSNSDSIFSPDPTDETSD